MITSPLLTQFPEIMHRFGDKNDEAPLEPLVSMHQVHGVHLHSVQDSKSQEVEGCDALLSSCRDVSLAVKTADCVPLLFFDPVKKTVAAVHAGWRGTVKGMANKTVQMMKQKGSLPADIRVAIGPCIRDCCFEVHHDVANPLQKQMLRWREVLIPHATDKKKWILDLQECNRLQLTEEGIIPEHIDVIPLCTSCRDDLFHSVRRDGDKAGRMMSFIRLL